MKNANKDHKCHDMGEDSALEAVELLSEGKTKFYAQKKEIVDREMSVFYNPAMRENRELSILVIINMIKEKAEKARKGDRKAKIRIAFPLSGSGLRPLRLLAENFEFFEKLLEEDIADIHIHVNDINDKSVFAIQKNFENEAVLKLKAYNNFHLKIHSLNAVEFLHKERHFDYIELDPFGSPNEFLDTAVMCMKDNGILAVTATDTAALTGTYPKTTVWKYWSNSSKTPVMHESGLRILIRKAAMHSASFARSATPLLSYYSLHYMKCFLRIKKGKRAAYDSMLLMKKAIILKNTGILLGYFEDKKPEFMVPEGIGDTEVILGPLFTGNLFDSKFVSHISALYDSAKEKSDALSKRLQKDFKFIAEESSIPNGYYFDAHHLSSALGRESVPKSSDIIQKIIKKGFRASRSIFGDTLIKTDIEMEKLREIM